MIQYRYKENPLPWWAYQRLVYFLLLRQWLLLLPVDALPHPVRDTPNPDG